MQPEASRSAASTRTKAAPGARGSSVSGCPPVRPQICPVPPNPVQRMASSNCCLPSTSELRCSPRGAGTLPRAAAGWRRSQAGARPKASARRALGLGGISLAFSSPPFTACVSPGGIRSPAGAGTCPARPRGQCPVPRCPQRSGHPPAHFPWHGATPGQPRVPLGGTWQQVPAPRRLIPLPATGQGLTGMNPPRRPLATCLSIRGANLPAPRAACRGAARSRLASSPRCTRSQAGDGWQGPLVSLNPQIPWAPPPGCW